MGNEAIELLKGLLSWASGIALLLIGFAWNHNEKAHKALTDKAEKAMQAAAKARQDASDSHSVLMDRFMEHVDDKNRETLGYVRAEDKKLMEELSIQRGHIAKLFDKLEDHGRHSENRHLEVLSELRAMSNQMHQALSQKADK